MTQFNKKYPKGLALFVLLTIYELPILLNYLFFGKKDWCIGSGHDSGSLIPGTTTKFGEKVGVHAKGNDSATV